MVAIVQLTDEELAAEAAREGSNGPAFMELLDRHRQRVWRICFRLMGNDHDAGDAAQEVFVTLFLKRAQFAGRSKYTTWMHGIAVRTCLTMRRGRGRRQKRETTTTDSPIHEQATSDATTSVSQSLDLMRMLEILDEEDRAMVILKHAEGYSFEELGNIFERSTSACKMRVSRALEKLRDRFPEEMKSKS